MGRHLLGFIISVLVHFALGTGVYMAFANDQIKAPKVKSPSTPLKLSMFVPPVKLVVEAIPEPKIEIIEAVKVVTPPPKPVIKKEQKVAKVKPKVIKKRKKKKIKKKVRKKKKIKKKVKIKPKSKPRPKVVVSPKKDTKPRKPRVRPKVVARAKPVAKPRPASRPKAVARPVQKPVTRATKPAVKPRPAPAANNRLSNSFKASVKRAIERNKRYPMSARRRNQQGTAVIAFTLMRDGSVKNARVARSSGFKKLDKAALKAVKGINRKLPIPNQLNKASWNFSVPIKFGL